MPKNPPKSRLLIDFEAFIRRHKRSPSIFCLMALNDPAFYLRLRKGRRPWRETEDRLRAAMAKYEAGL